MHQINKKKEQDSIYQRQSIRQINVGIDNGFSEVWSILKETAWTEVISEGIVFWLFC